MEISTISQIWRYFRWLPQFMMIRIFNQERLAGMTYLDVKPRQHSVKVNLGQPAKFDIYFQVINMSPYEIELDRSEIEFQCAGVRLKTLHIRKSKFTSGQISFFHVEGEISEINAENIALCCEENNSSITIHSDFNCSLHNFSKAQHNLEGVNVEFVNKNIRDNIHNRVARGV